MHRNWVICILFIVLAQFGLTARQGVIYETINTPSNYKRSSVDGSIFVGGFGEVWRWEDGVVTELGSGIASALSDDGSIIVGEIKQPSPQGYPNDTYSEAAFWQDGQVTPIGHLPGAEYLWSEGWEISGDGSIILGRSATGSGNEIFRYQNGVMTGLGLDGFPQAISLDGSKFIFENEGIHWLWDNGSVTQIPPLGDYTDMRIIEFAMSSDGSAFVATGYNGNQVVPIRWEANEPSALPFPEEATSSANGYGLLISGNGKVILGTCSYMANDVPVSDVFLWREAEDWAPVSLGSLLENSGLSYHPDINFFWSFVDGRINQDGTIIVHTQDHGICRILLVDLFGNYGIIDGIAETDAWLGRLHVTNAPWVWCETVSSWLNIPEQTADTGYGWMFAPDPDAIQIVQIHGTDWAYSLVLNKWLYLTSSGWVYFL